MNQVPLIAASMRSADVGHLADEIARLEEAKVDLLHFDVIDGRFGPEISMGPSFVRGLRTYSKMVFEVHLLVGEPEASLSSYVDAGADHLIIHVEATKDPASALQKIRDLKCKPGLAINPTSSSRTLEPFFSLCEKFNVMTIDPMKPGVVSEEGLRNMTEIAELVRTKKCSHHVQADGAVSLLVRDRFLEAGATSLVVGYPLFSSKNYGALVHDLRFGKEPAATRPI